VIRPVRLDAPITEHKHTAIGLLFLCVIQGQVKFDYVGHGERPLQGRSCPIVPPILSQIVTGVADDGEMIESNSQGKHKTINTGNGKEVAVAAWAER
jgi:hypothetical protein